MFDIWIPSILGLGGLTFTLLQHANDLRDFDLIQELPAHLAKIQSLARQVADKVDDVHDDVKIKKILAKTQNTRLSFTYDNTTHDISPDFRTYLKIDVPSQLVSVSSFGYRNSTHGRRSCTCAHWHDRTVSSSLLTY